MLFDAAGRVGVEITAQDTQQLMPSLAALGFQTIAALPAQHLIEGYLPTSSLVAANGLSSVGLMGVLPLYRPTTAAGSVADEADNIMESDRVRTTAPGYNGTGVTVGVLSDSYNNLGGAAADIASGDLPAAGVHVLQDLTSGGTDEGRAMLQEIHDVAPGAALAFATGDTGDAGFAQNIRDLANPSKGNCSVIVDDLTYFDEPFFQDGIIAQAVDDVVQNNGAAYFSSAGNNANQAYESTNVSFMADTIPAISASSASYYQYAPGVDRQRITLTAGQSCTFSLQWDQPFYTVNGVTTDLDIYVLDHNTGAVVASSTTANIATQTPLEICTVTNSGGSSNNYDVVIQRFAGPNPGRIKYVNLAAGHEGNITFDTYATNSSTISPHAAAADAMAVAAAPFYNQRTPETFTSQGPATILFAADGTPLSSAEVRAKPDITAIDGSSDDVFRHSLVQRRFVSFLRHVVVGAQRRSRRGVDESRPTRPSRRRRSTASSRPRPIRTSAARRETRTLSAPA